MKNNPETLFAAVIKSPITIFSIPNKAFSHTHKYINRLIYIVVRIDGGGGRRSRYSGEVLGFFSSGKEVPSFAASVRRAFFLVVNRELSWNEEKSGEHRRDGGGRGGGGHRREEEGGEIGEKAAQVRGAAGVFEGQRIHHRSLQMRMAFEGCRSQRLLPAQ